MPDDRQLVDREAIVDLTIAYCWSLDQRRFDDLHQVFTPTAVADFGDGPRRGLDAIIERVSSVLEPLDVSHHMVTNHQVRIDGGEATCRCYMQAQHVRHDAEGGRNFIVGGTYQDAFERTSAGWRIVERTLMMTWSDGNIGVIASG